LGILEKRAAIVSTLLGVPKDSSQSIFDIDVLVKEILRMTDKQMEEHRMAKIKKGESAVAPTGEGGGADMGGGGDFGGPSGGPEAGGGEALPPPEGGGAQPPPETEGGGAEEAV
jgi:hypothetical protein